MSLGGKKSNATTDTRLLGMNVNQSSYGNAIPLVYGRNRLPMTLLWYGNFTSTPSSSSGGGKGGGGSGNTTYTYTASMIMGICEGPMSAPIGQVWQDKVITTVAALGFTQFNGNGGQAVWSYLTTNYPSQAVPYDHTAYVAVANYSLGGSANMPNFTYEVSGFLSQTPVAITFTGGIGAGATAATLSAASTGLVGNGTWNITFSDNECRSCAIVGNAVTWNASAPLINTVSAAASLGGLDAEPSAILIDYSTDANHGCNFTGLGVIQGAGVLTYQSYCIAMGFFISPYESTQRNAVEFYKEILQITNSDAFVSAGTLNIVPYCDTSVSGNGRTYTPNMAPLFAFTEDDLMKGAGTFDDPIIVTRKPLAQTYNTVRVEFLDRSNNYVTAIAEATDATDIAINGVRVMDTQTFHEITVGAVAQTVAQLLLQRQLYIRNTFTFAVRADYCLLEPMDLVSLTDSNLGFTNKLVRLTTVGDDENDLITFTAEDVLVGAASTPLYNYQSAQGYAANWGAAPPSVGTPLIFAAPSLLVDSSGGYEMWAAADASVAGSWGGCEVYISLDNISYIFAGSMSGPARFGTLTAALASNPDPDTTDTLSITLTNPTTTTAQIVSGSAADYANLRTLIYVDGEIMAYQTATLTGVGTYNLTGLRRGLYGSLPAAHASGSQWARIDASIFRVPYDPGMIGQTMYWKFCSFNQFQKSQQLLSAATAYPHVLADINAGQNMPGALTLIGSGVTTAGNTAFKSTQTTAWDASVYSAQSFTNGCSVSCYMSSSDAGMGIMLGLTTSPTASNNYTNLPYAFYAAGSGALYIFEGGTNVGLFGYYSTNTLLNIVYDGKHIAYYASGVLLRSVPVTNLSPLYLQICIYVAGYSVYGIDYSPNGTAVTPFTLVPLTTYVAAVGTKVVANPLGASNWGNRVFQSKETYSNGCIASASVVNLSAAGLIGVTTAPAVGAPYPDGILAGWCPNSLGGISSIIFQGADLGSYGAPPTLADVYSVSYDNFNFYWYRNNTLVLQKAYPNAGPLYLFGDLYAPGAGFSNVSFLPFSPSTPQAFIARGTVYVSDTAVMKLASAGYLWTDGDAYSINGYTTCHLVAKPNSISTSMMIGLVPGGPPTTINYTNLTYGLYAASGTIQIYESGTLIGSYGGYAITDYFAMTYDGATVTYWHNSTSLRTVSVANLTMFADIIINNPSAGFNSVEFGPSATIPIADTAQLNAGAATSVAQFFDAGPETYSGSS